MSGLVDGLFEVAVHKRTTGRFRLFNASMTWQHSLQDLYISSQDMNIPEERWKRQMNRSISRLKIEYIPGTHAGKMTTKQYIKITIPNTANVSLYAVHRRRLVPPAQGINGPLVITSERRLIRSLFTTDLPLNRVPDIFIQAVKTNLKQWPNPETQSGRMIDLIIADLDINDPYVRLLLTIGLIFSSKNPIACATDCIVNKVWTATVDSTRPKWLAAFMFNGLWFGRDSVRLSYDDLPEYLSFSKGMIGKCKESKD
jgi:hypothetical protein